MVLTLFNKNKLYKTSEQIHDYTIEKVLGEGRFGICYQVLQGQKRYILKQLKRGILKKVVSNAHFEEEILRSLDHESIPHFIKKIDDEDFFGYVLQFKEGSTFEDMIYLDRHVFQKKEILDIGKQLVEILKYLHSKGVAHRDIRVPNTLYDGQNVNLIDFGLARWINDKRYKANMDFAFLGDFLLHLYYSSFDYKGGKKRPWYDELDLTEIEQLFLKRLLGVGPRYRNILEVEHDFNKLLL